MAAIKPFAFVGSFVSLRDEGIHPAISPAGSRLQQRYIDFLRPSAVYAIAPIFLPSTARLHYDSAVIQIHNACGGPECVRRLYRVVCDTLEVIYRLAAGKIRTVVFYNLEKQNALVFFLCRFVLRYETFVIVADYATFRKNYWSTLVNWLLGKASGALVLNSNIICNGNTQVLPGLVYTESIIKRQAKRLGPRVLLSGSLGKTTGLEFALEFFSTRPEMTLIVAGRAFRYTDEEFRAVFARYSSARNIQYVGVLDYHQHLKVVDDCDIALSLRDPDDTEHQYNFPSKILEYLSRGKIVVSTIRYKDVPDGILEYCDKSEPNLDALLKRLLRMSESELEARGDAIFHYLVAEYTEEPARKKLESLINGYAP